ncbi:MAG: ATP-dependent 6-phosphofructokinase [Spirochaetes bacterium]|jgi:6-phosphofructokinase 1|nr:ATP-dependent 6-phosphofructokinase [Spirochaetota bacterium]
MKKLDTNIKRLGEKTIPSPLQARFPLTSRVFVHGKMRILYNVLQRDVLAELETGELTAFEKGGPRKMIYHDPSKAKAAIVTCGGLCPGINDVIRAIVMESFYSYGIKNIVGIPYGYNGLLPQNQYNFISLEPANVDDIHNDGGTILGSSRGGTDDVGVLVDALERMNINILYTIGGDGTQRGAHKIATIAADRGYKLSVIGIPKTIDNDISFIERTFGFETAFSEAVKVIQRAHVEAKGVPNGIGLVKLMGRHSGFIAAHATLACNDVNYTLIPEVKFDLDGPNGFLKTLEARLERSDHAVIVVAEGAGQDLIQNESVAESRYDASGNVKLEDIGIFLKRKIEDYFSSIGSEANLKYIDPSYIVRSAPANENDSLFCAVLGQYAVHAAMAGKTDMLVGQWNSMITHIPIELAVSQRKQIDPDSRLWYDVLAATGQPIHMKNKN